MTWYDMTWHITALPQQSKKKCVCLSVCMSDIAQKIETIYVLIQCGVVDSPSVCLFGFLHFSLTIIFWIAPPSSVCHQSVCLWFGSYNLFLNLPYCLSVCPSLSFLFSIYLSISSSFCLSDWVEWVENKLCLCVCLYVCLSVSLSVFLYVCMSLCPSVCLSIWLPVRLSILYNLPFVSLSGG